MTRDEFLARLEAFLGEKLAPRDGSHARLQEAMAHTLLSGGKRLRPQLVLAAGRLGEPRYRALILGAGAVEMLHAYSLIHDDLPAMDDDDLRRGKPSCHKVYGEALAILAGDALQALAFETLVDAVEEADLARESGLALLGNFARAAGAEMLVGGQAADLDPDGRDVGIDALRSVHERKTGALIRFSLELGASLSGCKAFDLGEAGRLLGLAFQVVDDLLDGTSSSEELGKTPGKDRESGKRTYLDILGAEGCRLEASRLLKDSLALLPDGSEAAELRDLARRLVERSF